MAQGSGGDARRRGAHFSEPSAPKEGDRQRAGGSHAQRKPRFRMPTEQEARQQAFMPSPRVSTSTAAATQRAAINAGQRPDDFFASTNAQASPRRRFVRALLIALIVVGLGAAGWFAWQRFAPHEEDAQVEAGQAVTVTVPDGAGALQIAQLLSESGVISDTAGFLREVQAQNADASMKSGTYSFVTAGNVREVVHQLVLGPNSSEHKVTVAEGLTVARTAAVVESALGIPADDFVAQAKASNYVGDYDFLAEAGEDSLEGFLYPKTYDLGGKDLSADSVIRLMLDQYRAEVLSLDLDGARATLAGRYGVQLSNYDILKIASIIEREAITAGDRPLVSSVLYNRLRQDMALQSDATMGYVTGGEVTAADLEIESPYNTYKHKGLTPTPICNPSLASIQAALAPADTNYFFFLIVEENGYSNHTFSETYDEHQEAIEQVRAERS